ncbi:MAG TPA: 30S ribosomal protein S20 [Candidatus Paceibacterota bacterium]|nr:30S ribosomal protein S20 [Candidatus Paceibacterota bacterium]
MPITSSAKKALRASKKKRVFNLRRKNNIDNAIKTVKRLVADKKGSEATKALAAAYAALDKAAKGKLIKKNAASRRKARLAAFVKKTA